MAGPTLHGNGHPCPAGELRREVEDKTLILRPGIACSVCKGVGSLGFTEAEIVARTVKEARRLYWPAFEVRATRQNEVDHA
ncbi:hypothetical protein [Rhodobacter sp. 24-YEA-8]|uniref:hypothetical protein n=1 Tax=Rhodobacter sp. 24-YEA-8 TaxID=1884310 RepID=UPI00089D368F|nr:hypothetical protein [Rhodobacter sp. 24-YEA-8]SEB96728.1 hypothetical protein SAMN05519105_1678 [Rhodobacter sp. 24-YEA-8]